MDEETFIFGSFRLVPAQRVLLDDGKPLRLGSRAFDILITLVEHAGETISNEQLIAHTWPDTVVDDGALRVHIAALRSEEHTSELQSQSNLVCRLLLEK